MQNIQSNTQNFHFAVEITSDNLNLPSGTAVYCKQGAIDTTKPVVIRKQMPAFYERFEKNLDFIFVGFITYLFDDVISLENIRGEILHTFNTEEIEILGQVEGLMTDEKTVIEKEFVRYGH